MNQLNLFSINDNGKNFSVAYDALGVGNNTPAWSDKFGNTVRKWIEGSGTTPIQTLSLFSGSSGLDIGFDIVASVEIEEKFCETLAMNTGKGKRFENSYVNCIDIREFSGKDLGEIDFIIGGPPCQTLSASGRQANGVLGMRDVRGVLFCE